MIPGMDPRAMQQAMKKMGIKQIEIPAHEVIIRAEGKDIIIKNPQVSKIDMMGQISWQIVGEAIEQISGPEFTAEDIKTVMDQAQVSEDAASAALKKSDGDLAKAILSIQEQ